MTDFALSYPNSPKFNERHWIASRMALAFANASKTSKVRLARSVMVAEIPAVCVTASAMRVNEIRNPVVTEVAIDAAKVTNTERARLLGFTVKTLRAQCRLEGMSGYSKARKADLVGMLLANPL